VEEELYQAKQYYHYKERCIFCDIIHQETVSKKRVTFENEDFIAIAPFASRSPFETMILPKRHASSFDPKNNVSQLAEILQRTLKQIDRVLDLPPYNFMIHTSPINNEINDHYHWHIEILPKLTKIAGFEWGSGFHINPTPPEEAAQFMREAAV